MAKARDYLGHRESSSKMILYFDNLITNVPLIPGFYTELDAIRDANKNYSSKDKYEITLYTLASYAELEWSEVIIVYEFDKDLAHKKKEFETFVKKLWPKAHIFYGRSDNQKKFQKQVEFINQFKDDWIFYAGNNDHPFVAPNKKTWEACIKKSKELAKKHKYVSFLYSHFPEGYNMAREGTAIHDLAYPNSKIIEENKELIVANFPKGWNTAIQVVNKKLLNHWVFSKDLGDQIFRRIEAMEPYVETKDQFIILPKKEMFSHFDGYSHTKFAGYPILSNVVPPLFIPQGYFEKNIKVRYGYEDYKEGWVNINPMKEKYSFEDTKNGTDLKIDLQDIPLFWKKRIKRVEISPNIDKIAMKKAIDKDYRLVQCPFRTSKEKGYYKHIKRFKMKRAIYDSKLFKPVFKVYKKSKFLKKVHSWVNRRIFS